MIKLQKSKAKQPHVWAVEKCTHSQDWFPDFGRVYSTRLEAKVSLQRAQLLYPEKLIRFRIRKYTRSEP